MNLIQQEIEKASAKSLNDLAYEACCSMFELPVIREHTFVIGPDPEVRAAMAAIMAICIEAGIQIGHQSALESMYELKGGIYD